MDEKMVSAFLANCMADLFFLCFFFFFGFLVQTVGTFYISFHIIIGFLHGVKGLMDAAYRDVTGPTVREAAGGFKYIP